MSVLAGVDGCKSGFVAAIDHDGALDIEVFPSFESLTHALGPDVLIAIDMPIGLPRTVGPGGRAAEVAARSVLGPRKSSVFSVPARCAVYAGVRSKPPDMLERFRNANAIARLRSQSGTGFSLQAFHILPKIVEIDRVIRRTPGLASKVFEVHPEMAFRAMAGGVACAHSKKTSAGYHERCSLLLSSGFAPEVLTRKRASGVGRDDQNDALACLVVARRLRAGTAMSYPNPPERDGFGLQIAIWA
jgi:predicted RNase H-like nuclease